MIAPKPVVLVVRRAGGDVLDEYHSIYLAPDMVVLVLEILEFCSQDPKTLAQVRPCVRSCSRSRSRADALQVLRTTAT